MFQKKAIYSLLPALAVTLVTSIISLSSAEAQDNSGLSVGKIRFGKQSDDKWLTVDMKRKTSGSGPTVGTNSTQSFFSRSPRTSATTTYFDVSARNSLPTSYPAASSTVSNHRLLQAASIAVNNARGHSTGSCWRYVKSALLKSETIDSYPKTGYAKQAASELVHDYGFVRTTISNPFAAPIGSVLVYGGNGAGHVEIRTRTGFVSDFVSQKPSSRPLIGVFVKR